MLESKDAVLVATSLVLAVSTIVSVTIELERQLATVGRLTASKWFLVLSAFFALLMTSIVCAAAAKGLGASITPVEFLTRETLQKLIVAALPPYFLCNMFVKHAWLTFYYGLAQTRAQRYFIHLMQFSAFTFGLSSVFVILLQCIPLSYAWRQYQDPTGELEKGKCINLLSYFYFNASFMIANDVVMYLIPMVLLWKVETLREHRWSLYALFAVCFVVILASIFRLVAVYEIDTSPNRISENYALVFIWAGVENHIGICAACAGALKARVCMTYRRVKMLSVDLRNKSWLASASAPGSASTSTGSRTDTATRSQITEERTLYERTSSLPSLHLAGPISFDKGPRGTVTELVDIRQPKSACSSASHSRATSEDSQTSTLQQK
ncbi:hypothetical protein AYO21_07192 [Fonsecaea monophora]|uniref:Rhodopsin domain-containing protein n=1 Tax=Fonsecaea monophora TaxID=254056 RepID=A0A177F599_9EURO|nr:hypothetical protein AYO21_07192 [Fonsecaea monophora]KAH0843530.1 hypothetical protein FOPE_08792 [Fonsecaea pedrosoi]OAG38532.1 hypothetical protein AYO21_07192 [Fonsecaea monophora]